MNYIAHLHLADHTNTELLGNFLGDFVKGSDWRELSVEKQIGVRLHRWIDSFTDGHSRIRALHDLFPGKLRRFAGMAIDIYFDHLLIAHWSDYADQPAELLFERFYQQLEEAPGNLPVAPHYHSVRERLILHRWLDSYVDRETCLLALQVLQKRSRFRVNFAEQCYAIARENHVELLGQFNMFYPELMVASQRAAKSLEQEYAL